MNNKGEALTLGIIFLALLVIGLIAIEDKIEKEIYVGDKSTNITYNLKSINVECNINEIKINKDNIKFFETKEQAVLEGYYISEICY